MKDLVMKDLLNKQERIDLEISFLENELQRAEVSEEEQETLRVWLIALNWVNRLKEEGNA
jgi:hypothetical protein